MNTIVVIKDGYVLKFKSWFPIRSNDGKYIYTCSKSCKTSWIWSKYSL